MFHNDAAAESLHILLINPHDRSDNLFHYEIGL